MSLQYKDNKKYIFLFELIYVMLIILFFLLGLEIFLRLKGYNAFQFRINREVSVTANPDAVLGWKSRPGVYTKWPRKWSHGKPIRVTVWPNEARATATEHTTRARQIFIVGCSFSFGWALSDEETFAWKLQRLFPGVTIMNFGTASYGTYQALLSLEQKLKGLKKPPELVLYGFADFHEPRNVAAPHWLRFLVGRKINFMISPPYCLPDGKGGLARCSPIAYPVNFLNLRSAAVDFLLMRFLSIGKGNETQKEVTKKLLLEMDNLCRRRGTKMVVLLLSATESNRIRYVNFFNENHVDFVDCTFAQRTVKNYFVNGEWQHPSAEVNTYWAKLVSESTLVRRRYKES